MSTEHKFLYRGVHAGHPAHAEAVRGIVRPGNVDGTVFPCDHNTGGYSAESPYTSWTTDRQRALYYANRKGPGGLLLTVEVGPPETHDAWHWEWSCDDYFEDEILLRGIRVDVKAVTL